MTKTITFENVYPFQDLPVLVAHHEGLFKDEGVDVEFIGGSGSAAIKTDRNITSPDQVSSLIGHGSRSETKKAVMYNACEWGNYRRTQDTGVGAKQIGRRASIAYGAIIVPPGSSIVTPQQLADVTIGLPYYNGTHYLAIQMLEGFVPRDMIKTCQAPTGARGRYHSLMNGELDATTVVEPYITVAEKAGCGIIAESCYHGTEVASDELDMEAYAGFKRAVKKAVERINANKREYVHYFIDYHKDDPVVAALTVDDFNLSRIQVIEPQTIPESELQRTYDWMISWDMINSSFGVENLVDENVQRGGMEALGVLSDD